MNNQPTKKRWSKEVVIIVAIVGAISGGSSGWLRSEFGFDLLTRFLILLIVGGVVGGIAYLFLRNK